MYTRGSSDDYDNWARVTGDNRWRWRALRPYILRVSCVQLHARVAADEVQHEQWTEPAGGRDPTGEYEPRFHGTKGNVHTSLSWNAHNKHDIRVVRNSAFPGSEFPFAKDVNSGSPLGACEFALACKTHVRVTDFHLSLETKYYRQRGTLFSG